MTADAAGNNIMQVRVVTTSKIRLAPYDSTQKLTAALIASTVADRHSVVEHGKVIDMIPNDQVKANLGKLEEYLGV